MENLFVEDLVGIYEEDGSVKCRNCMKKEDWENLKKENVIASSQLEKDEEWLYCDYCEHKLT